MQKQTSLGLYIIIMSGLVMIGVFAMDSFLPALGLIAKDFAVSESIAQQTVSAYFFGYAVLSIITGPLADSIGRKKIILINSFLFLITSCACVLSPNIEFLIIMRFVQGASAGAIWTAGRVMTYELFPEEKAKQAFGILAIVFSIGPAIAPVIGGWMVHSFSWAGSFYVMIVVSIFAIITGLIYLPESLNHEDRVPLNFRQVFSNYGILLRNKFALIVLAAIALLVSGNYLYISASHRFLIDLLGLKPTQFAYLYWPLTLGNFIAGIVNAKFTYKISSRRVATVSLCIMLTAVVSNVLLSASHINYVLLLVLPLAVYTFGISILLPTLMIELMKTAQGLRGFASVLFSIGIFLLNSLIAGFILPLIWYNTLNLALLQLLLLLGGMYTCYLMLERPD